MFPATPLCRAGKIAFCSRHQKIKLRSPPCATATTHVAGFFDSKIRDCKLNNALEEGHFGSSTTAKLKSSAAHGTAGNSTSKPGGSDQSVREPFR
jgi:hypothetical protein